MLQRGHSSVPGQDIYVNWQLYLSFLHIENTGPNKSQTCVFQGGFDKKHQVSIVPKLDHLLYIYQGLRPRMLLVG